MSRQQRRNRSGRFDGSRVNLDQVPRLPIFPAQWTLDDPRRRTYFVFWTDPRDPKLLVRALLMERADDDRAVVMSTPYILRRRIALERRHQWGGEVLFYVCAGCQRLRRHLYPWPMIDGRLTQDLNPRCGQCAGLRYLCQGIPGGGTSSEPWDPWAVSDARMVASEFPGSLVIQRDDVRDEQRPPEPGAPEYLTRVQAAELLGLHPRTVLEYVRRGELQGRVIGGRWRFRRRDIDAFFDAVPFQCEFYSEFVTRKPATEK